MGQSPHHQRESESCSVMSDFLQLHGQYRSWNSLGQNTGVGSLSLLQGIFWTQGSNPGLPCCRWILYKLSHQGSSRILEWVACPFSSRSSWLRNWTRVSCIAGEFFTNWDIREPLTSLCASEFEPQGISGPSMHHPVNRKKSYNLPHPKVKVS